MNVPRIDLTKIQVSAVRDMLHDALADDERAYLDTLEGETDLYELSRILLNRIEEDEGMQAVLAEQIADRTARRKRAGERVEHNREAIKALLECAGLNKLVLAEATLSIRDVSPKAIVTDEAAVPDELCRFIRKPDLAAIKVGLESGATIPGVSLDNGGNSLTIRRK
jgi:hypothetical protein